MHHKARACMFASQGSCITRLVHACSHHKACASQGSCMHVRITRLVHHKARAWMFASQGSCITRLVLAAVVSCSCWSNRARAAYVLYKCTHVGEHTHTHSHTHLGMHTNKHTHTHTHTHSHSHSHSHSHTLRHAHKQTYARTIFCAWVGIEHHRQQRHRVAHQDDKQRLAGWHACAVVMKGTQG